MTVEIVNNVSVNDVDASMRLISNEKVEKAGIKRLKDLLHRGIGREQVALTGICFHARGNDPCGLR